MLNQNELRELKHTLTRRFGDLREEIRQELLQSDQAHFIDLAGQVHDLQDESVADLLIDLDLAVIDMHVEEIRDIDAALMRMATGSYGVCRDCESEIELARLNAWPTARRCEPCQSRREREYPGPAHPTL